MLCREPQWVTGYALSGRRLLSPKLTNQRTNYRLTRAVSIWSTLVIAAITGSSVFAQDVHLSVVHAAATFQITEEHEANQAENGIFQSVLQRRYLFRDWNRERSTLEEKGITFDFYYMDDALANPYGGREDAGLWGRIRGSADVDFNKLTSGND